MFKYSELMHKSNCLSISRFKRISKARMHSLKHPIFRSRWKTERRETSLSDETYNSFTGMWLENNSASSIEPCPSSDHPFQIVRFSSPFVLPLRNVLVLEKRTHSSTEHAFSTLRNTIQPWRSNRASQLSETWGIYNTRRAGKLHRAR